MIRSQVREDLISFLDTIRRPHYPIDTIGDRDSLVQSGLIDSLAVLQIVLFLEKTYGIDFAESGFDPDELGSISEILDLIERRSR